MSSNGNGNVTPPEGENPDDTVEAVGTAADFRLRLAKIQAEADQTNRQAQQLDAKAEKVAELVREARQALATIPNR
jgi:hypothetical protein